MSVDTPRVILAGGGTGGHVIPALAVAEEIVKRGGQVSFVGTDKRLEARLVPKAGFEIDFVEVLPLVAGGVAKTIRSLFSIPPALLRSFRVLRKRKPHVVMGVGGYVAGPVVLAAKILGIATAVLEQNALVGMTNRLLTRFVDRAFVSYEETASAFPSGIATVTGNPVMGKIVEAAAKRTEKALNAPLHVTVMGGSQGALAIDERVPRAFGRSDVAKRVKVMHQCGGDRQKEVEAAYHESGISATVVPFIENTDTVFKITDLVVARAGATTISELAVMGLPAILLPYPHHKDQQQALNARPMERAGAAVVLDEKKTDVDDMARAIRQFVLDDVRRKNASDAARALGRPRATQDVVDGIYALAGGA